VEQLTSAQRRILDRVVDQLRGAPGLKAIVLGGSHARGRARPHSDIDVGLLYAEAAPLDVAFIRAAAARLNDDPDPVVSERGGWGRWVDGGAWLTIDGQRVDLLYRSIDAVERTRSDAIGGRYEIDWAQQPPFGYFGPTLLGEAAIARPLWDPDGAAARLGDLARPFPDALADAVAQGELWGVDFGLRAFAPKYVETGNVLALAGCLTRFARALVLALFALNRTWLLNDKTALAEISAFAAKPDDFGPRLEALLAAVGRSPTELAASNDAMQRLFDETAALAGDSYRPAWRI
jgi:hypothetical protein